ncbi:MAG: hypothetical protein NVSMB9_25620 [Isosphaeraceae bacterium]
MRGRKNLVRGTQGILDRFSGLELLEGRRLLASGALPGWGGAYLNGRSFPSSHLATLSTPSLRAESLSRNTHGAVHSFLNVVYRNAEGRQEHLDLYVPAGPAPPGGYPTILALPGGGWRWVRRNDLGITVSSLARYGYVVAVADYAFASSRPGTHVWPTNFDDVRQAVRWLKTSGGTYGVDPNRIAVWGESAGGHLANLLGTNPDGPLVGLREVRSHDPRTAGVSARVQAVIDFYGPTDLNTLYRDSQKDRQYLDTLMGGGPERLGDRYQAASPIGSISSSAPPFLIFQGTADTAVPASQSVVFSEALRQAGVPANLELIPGIGHGFRLKVGNIDYLPRILAFLDASLNSRQVNPR